MSKSTGLNATRTDITPSAIIGFTLFYLFYMAMPTQAMTYHNNDVTFSVSASGYTLKSGSYVVNDFSVTKGQDPDHKIHNGLTPRMNGDGRMTFRVGRKGSEETAAWFNNKVPAAQTTFNHTAGKLNFAFLGTLTLELTGGILGGGKDTYTFSNIGIAQGHSGTSNNWWFGGQNCANISGNRVSCNGIDTKGNPVSFVFLRGGNDASTVAVTPVTLVDTLAWMGRKPDSTRLDEIVMPGSHDAGLSETHHCDFLSGMGKGYVVTQGISVGGQLAHGSRYFDIRVDYDHGKLVTYHRTNDMGCNGQDLRTVLDQTVDFLAAHPSETAILKISHIRSNRGDAANIKERINALLKQDYNTAMYRNPEAGVNLSGVTLGDVRGKMIIAFDYDDYIDPTTGRFRYKDGYNDKKCTTQPSANLTVCDAYSETASYDKMEKDQLEKWRHCAGLGAGHMFLLSWTLTSTPVIDSTIKTLADQANAKLPGVLYNQIVVLGAAKPNIVYIDFVNSATTQSIIRYNF
ncbi:MAG: hypothetical protein MI799_19470 [Desulfobacterales bacterium]|nr:hypothetical protein [Desulfobacterales bacterium]